MPKTSSIMRSSVTVFPSGSILRAFSPSQTKVYTGLFMPNGTIRRLRVSNETRRKQIDLGYWENLHALMSSIPETYRVVIERAPATAQLDAVATNYGFHVQEDGTYVCFPKGPKGSNGPTATAATTATIRQQRAMILRSEKPRTTALVLADGSVKLLRNGRMTFKSFPNPILYTSVAEYMTAHGLNEGTVSKHERY